MAVGAAQPGEATTSTNPTGDLSVAALPCQPWTITGKHFRDAQSIEHLLDDAPNLATVTQLTDGAGSRAEMTTPPIGWHPVGATQAELAAYGFSRPTDPAAQAQWDKTFAGYKADVTPSVCSDPSILNWYGNFEWTGAVVSRDNRDFSKLTGYTRVQQYVASCQTSSAVSVWEGLGGTEGEPLLQAGIVTPQNGTLNEMWPFFEGIMKGNVPTPATYYFGASAVGADVTNFRTKPGESIYVHVQYNAFDGPNAQFEVFDNDQGVHASIVVTEIQHTPVKDFYSGHTAEFIVERPRIGSGARTGQQFELRHFTSDYHWNLAEVWAAGGIGYDVADYQLETNNATVDGKTGGPYVANVANPPGYSTHNSFYVHWDQCPNNAPTADPLPDLVVPGI